MMPATRRLGVRPGFTLIEVLVVIMVIGALAALVGPNVLRHMDTARNVTARSQIEMLSAALDAYQIDNGILPTNEQGLQALWREPLLDPRPRNWRGPYLRKPIPADPWQRPYQYLSPAAESTWGYDLFSFGRDGLVGGEGEDADVKAWE